MTSARCCGGIAAESARRPPRNATPNPAPPISAPSQNSAGVSVQAAMTIAIMPVASASEPPAVPAHGRGAAERELRGGAGAGQREDAQPGHEVVVGVQQLADSAGPSERNRPPIDQLEITASAARKNGRRTSAGMLGRCGVSVTRPVACDGLGHPQRAVEGDREQDEQDDVGEHAGRGGELDQRRRRSRCRGPCRRR